MERNMNIDVGYSEYIRNNILNWSFKGIVNPDDLSSADNSKILYYVNTYI